MYHIVMITEESFSDEGRIGRNRWISRFCEIGIEITISKATSTIAGVQNIDTSNLIN